jgi:hypothetical protein
MAKKTPSISIMKKNDVAEQSVLTNYINSLCVDKYMT